MFSKTNDGPLPRNDFSFGEFTAHDLMLAFVGEISQLRPGRRHNAIAI
jgi:hypothetical protein